MDNPGAIDHFDSAQVIAGQTPFPGEHPLAAAKCKTRQPDGSTRSCRQETPFRQEKLVYFFQSTTGACSQNAGLWIKLDLAHRRNTDDQSIVVEAKSFKGMTSCFYCDRPIFCFGSLNGALNASLRYTGSDYFRLD